MRPEYFTNQFGLIVDYLAEFMREMRKYSFADAVDKHFELGNDLNQRDTIAIRRTVSGLLKLLHPHGKFDKEAVRRCLKHALEARRRVKEQLFKIGGDEFKDVNFGYIDKETRESHIIEVPEHSGFSRENTEPEVKGGLAKDVPPVPPQVEAGVANENVKEEKTTKVLKLISGDENSIVEFKSSARWNHHKGGVHTGVELSIVRTVAGFMNAKGGTLLIGVNDDGKVVGMENDFKTTQKGNRDGFSLWLINKVVECIGTGVAINTEVDFCSIEGMDVCLVEVKASSKPVFVNMSKENIVDEFYVRMNNQTRRLNKAELLDYEKDRWG